MTYRLPLQHLHFHCPPLLENEYITGDKDRLDLSPTYDGTYLSRLWIEYHDHPEYKYGRLHHDHPGMWGHSTSEHELFRVNGMLPHFHYTEQHDIIYHLHLGRSGMTRSHLSHTHASMIGWGSTEHALWQFYSKVWIKNPYKRIYKEHYHVDTLLDKVTAHQHHHFNKQHSHKYIPGCSVSNRSEAEQILQLLQLQEVIVT